MQVGTGSPRAPMLTGTHSLLQAFFACMQT